MQWSTAVYQILRCSLPKANSDTNQGVSAILINLKGRQETLSSYLLNMARKERSTYIKRVTIPPGENTYKEPPPPQKKKQIETAQEANRYKLKENSHKMTERDTKQKKWYEVAQGCNTSKAESRPDICFQHREKEERKDIKYAQRNRMYTATAGPDQYATAVTLHIGDLDQRGQQLFQRIIHVRSNMTWTRTITLSQSSKANIHHAIYKEYHRPHEEKRRSLMPSKRHTAP